MIGFYYPTFANMSVYWAPASDPVYPLDYGFDFPYNLRGESAGGTLYVQNKGPARTMFNLKFELVSKTDRDGWLAFFNVVQREFKTFEYKDFDAALHTVRVLNPFNFQLDRYNLYSGSVLLRKE